MTEPAKFPQAPNAPGWKEKPKAGGVFAIAVLCCGIAAALLPSEARKLTVYKDSAGIDTVCMGLIGPITKRHPGQPFTVDECKQAEVEYFTPMVRQMAKCVPANVTADMSYGEWVTYGHWAYNTGTASFCNSTLGRKLAAGDHEGACRAMGAWTFITVKGRKVNCRTAGRLCPGIVTRRDLEVSMCLEAL